MASLLCREERRVLCPGSVPRLSCVPQAHVREGDCFFFFFPYLDEDSPVKIIWGEGRVFRVCVRE